MAKKNKATVARKPISFKSDTFESFGLMNDVDVEITGATYKPFNFNGTSRVRDTEIPNHIGILEITYDVDGEEKKDQLSYGGLDLYCPSTDGKEPAGGDDDDYIGLATGDVEEASDDMEGPYLVPVYHDGKAKRGNLSDSTALAFFFRSLETCANAAGIELSDSDNIEEYLVGLKGHVNRLRNDRLGRNVPEGKGLVLVFTELEEGPSAGKKKTGKKASKPAKDEEEEETVTPKRKPGRPKKEKPAPEPEAEEDDDEEEEEETTTPKRGKKSSASSDDDDDEFTEQVKDAVLEILNNNGGECKKLKLTKVTDAFKKKSDKERALAMVTEEFDDFIESVDELEFDPSTKMVSLA
jgi:hypothetical protein